MKKYITRKNVIAILCVVELFLIISSLVSLNNKDISKYIADVPTIDSEMFAILLEDDKGEYKDSAKDAFPEYADGYTYNNELSSCIDKNGVKIEGALSYDDSTQKVTVSVQKTTYCYLYFKKIPYIQNYLIRHNDEFKMWESGLEGDGYRFVGSGNANASTTPKNFVCFGTSDKSQCTSNPNNYMYRIIGVFPDASGTQYVKLIKYASLTSAMAWNGNYSNDIAWEASDLYKNLNGSTFLTNTTYVPNATWSNKIANWKWSAVNTKTYSDSGPNFYDSVSPSNIYLQEMNRSNKPSTIGSWTTPTAKIGLMYASDYTLSLGQTAKNMTTGTHTNRTTLKTGWMFVNNNSNTSGTSVEWTISRYGFHGLSGGYYAWYVNSGGYFDWTNVNYTSAVRPTFYLNEYNEYKSGSGTITDPIILGGITPPDVEATKNDNMIIGKVTKGDNKVIQYCVNTSATGKGCSWKSLSGTSITYNVPDFGTYYIHVKDEKGLVGHSNGVEFKLTLLGKMKEAARAGVLWENSASGIPEQYDYRYFGKNPDNYVCFGTSDTKECTSNPNNYMYRIIGVFPDENSVGHVKLIKYASLSAGMAWNADWKSDIAWEQSDMFKNLNGSAFLTNTTYVPNSTWSNKIANWRWSAVNTKSLENPGTEGFSIPYVYMKPKDVYLHELNKIRDNEYTFMNPDTGEEVVNDFTTGEWTTPSAKIGLMYVSDYLMSLGSSSMNMDSMTDAATMRTGWMHIANNAYGFTSGYYQYEWTISRIGFYNGYYNAWYVIDDGYVGYAYVGDGSAARPVFYLESDVELQGGRGTIDDPYILN